MKQMIGILLGLASFGIAQATECVWIGANGANWSDASNWQGGVVPNGAGDSAVFNGAGGTLYQNVAGLKLGGLTFGGTGDYTIYTNASNYGIILGGTEPAITVAEGRKATFEVLLNGLAADAQTLVKKGAGTVWFNQYMGRSTRFQSVEVAGGAIYLGFPESSDGLQVASTVTLRAGATFTTLRPNQVVNWVIYQIDAGGRLDMNGCGDAIGAFAGAGTVTNASGKCMIPRDVTFSGLVYGNIELANQANLGAGTWTIGSSNALAGCGLTLNGTNAVGKLQLAFAPGIGTFAVKSFSGKSVLPLLLEDTAGQPITLQFAKGAPNVQMGYPLVGSGNLESLSSGTVELNSTTNLYTGQTLASAGTLRLGSSTVGARSQDSFITNSSALVIASGASFEYQNESDGVLPPVTGRGTLKKSKGSTLTLNSFGLTGGMVNIYSGAVVVAGGRTTATNTFNLFNTSAPHLTLTFAGGETTNNQIYADDNSPLEPIRITGGRHNFTSLQGTGYRSFFQTGGESSFDYETGFGAACLTDIFVTVTGGRMVLNSAVNVWPQGLGLFATGPGTVVETHQAADRTFRIASDGVSHSLIISNGASFFADNALNICSPGASNISTGQIWVVDGGLLTMGAGFQCLGDNNLAVTRIHLDGGTLATAFSVNGNLDYASHCTNHTMTIGVRGARLVANAANLTPGMRSTVSAQLSNPVIPAPENAGTDGGVEFSGNVPWILTTNSTYAGPTLVRGAMNLTLPVINAPLFASDSLTLRSGWLRYINPVKFPQFLASNSGSALHYSGGANLFFDNVFGGVTIGPSGAAADASLIREDHGVFIIHPAVVSGVYYALGGETCVKVPGGLAMASNGMVKQPVFCDQVISGNDRHVIDFLTYDPTVGLKAVTYTEGLGGGAESLANVTTQTTLSADAHVYALRVVAGANPILTLASDKTLTIGNGVEPACLAINNHAGRQAVIKGGTIDFGASEGIILANLLYSGTTCASIESVLTGTGGLTLSPVEGGGLRLSGDNTYTGGTTILNNRVEVMKATSLGSGDVTVCGGSYVGGQLSVCAAVTLANNLHLSGCGATGLGASTGFGGALIFMANGGISGTVELTDATVIGVNSSSTATLSGSVGGSGSLTTVGNGMLVLAGANSYTGATVIANGSTLVVGPSGTVGAGPIEINGTLRLMNTDTLVMTNTITGSGTLFLAGAGRVELTGTNHFTGAVVMTGGTFDLVGEDAAVSLLSGTGLITNSVAEAATLTADQSGLAIFSGTIADGEGAVALKKAGAGMLTLSGTNTYRGTTAVAAGTLRLGNAQAFATLPITNGLVVRLDASETSSLTLDGTNVTAWADADGRAVLFRQMTNEYQPVLVANSMNGLDALYFPGLLQHVVATNTLNCRTVLIANRVMTGSHPNTALNKNGWNCVGIFGKNGADSGIRLSSQTGWDASSMMQYGYLAVNGISGNKFTAGQTHVLSAIPATSYTFQAALGDYWHSTNYYRSYYGHIGEVLVYNTLLGDYDRSLAETYLMQKWMGLAVATEKRTNVLSAATTVAVAAGATLDLNGADQELAALTGAGEVTNTTATESILTVGGSGLDGEFDGVISGSNTLVKVGSGVMTLGGASTYSGQTRVEAGTLRLAVDNALPEGTVLDVAEGAVLDLNGYDQTVAGVTGAGRVIGGTLIITGFLAPGGEGTIGTLTFAAAPDCSAGCELRIDTRVSGACDVLSIEGDVNLSSLALVVATKDQLESLRYRIVTCGGTLSGAFTSANITLAWRVIYETTPGDGSATLLHLLGTGVILR